MTGTIEWSSIHSEYERDRENLLSRKQKIKICCIGRQCRTQSPSIDDAGGCPHLLGTIPSVISRIYSIHGIGAEGDVNGKRHVILMRETGSLTFSREPL